MKAYIKDDFKNLLEYRQWVNEKIKNLSFRNTSQLYRFSKEDVENKIKNDPSWFGENTTYRELVEGITEYKSPGLITEVYNQINDKITTSTREQIKARKIKYNPVGLGVFIFDRAAMGLYRLHQFYSLSHHKVVQDNEVSTIGKNHFLKIDRTPVIRRLEEHPDGSPKVRTSNKNVFAYFPTVKKESQAVELFIGCGGHVGIKAKEFLYSGIGAIVIAQLLEIARIKTKISIVIGTSPDAFQHSAYAAIVPVKNYDENLDVNLLALLSSDPRFYRYEGFMGIISVYDFFGAKCPAALGPGVGKDTLRKMIEESDYAQKAKLAPNRFYFGRIFTEAETVSHINKTIQEIAERMGNV